MLESEIKLTNSKFKKDDFETKSMRDGLRFDTEYRFKRNHVSIYNDDVLDLYKK